MTDRPVGLGETGAAQTGGDRGEWITSLFEHALDQRLAFVTYFEIDTQRSWRVAEDPDAIEALADAHRMTRAKPGTERRS